MLSTWDCICEEMKKIIGEDDFKQWVLPIKSIENGENELILLVPDTYFARFFSNKYQEIIEEEYWKLKRKKPVIKILISNAEKNSITHNSDNLHSITFPSTHTFENFVVGSSNQVAYSAAMLVARNPSTSYNPFFIFGGVGVGKTHLLHAIGNYIRKNLPKLRVIYTSAETYVNEVMSCVRAKKMDVFRYKYRGQCEVFLVDDIQYLGGKSTTKDFFPQEEFYHCFNYLHSAGKQIVISSDQYPHHIPNITERLKSRFQWGLITDIATPEFETRVKILKNKAEKEKIQLSDDVAHYIAGEFSSNVRELEGALNRVVAYSKINQIPISLDMAKEIIIKDMASKKSEKISITTISKIVANYFNLKHSDLMSVKRNRGVAIPRQIAMFLSRQHTSSSLMEIGAYFGKRDHTTVINAVKKIHEKAQNDNLVERAIKDIEKQLGV